MEQEPVDPAHTNADGTRKLTRRELLAARLRKTNREVQGTGQRSPQTGRTDGLQVEGVSGMTRRDFLKGSMQVAAAGVFISVATSCGVRPLVGGQAWTPPFDGVISDQTWAYADVVPPAPSRISRGMLRFFGTEEARHVEALTATIMPGSPDDPGAREAGVLTFIDTYLAKADSPWWQPTYSEGPFMETYEGQEPPASSTSFQRIMVQKDMAERYGFQSRLTPRDIYRGGINSLNQYCQQQYGAPFADLSSSQQEEVVGALSEGNIGTFSEPSASLFFEMVRQDTIWGMFADPAYGGNQNMVGWQLVGYPGVHRAYTPHDLLTEDDPKPLQTLDGLPHFHPSIGEDGTVIRPVSDEDPTNQTVRKAPHH